MNVSQDTFIQVDMTLNYIPVLDVRKFNLRTHEFPFELARSAHVRQLKRELWSLFKDISWKPKMKHEVQGHTDVVK